VHRSSGLARIPSLELAQAPRQVHPRVDCPVAEFERESGNVSGKGIAVAKVQDRYRGGKAKLAPEKARELAARVRAVKPKAKLAREYGISRETVYQYLRQSGSAVKRGLAVA